MQNVIFFTSEIKAAFGIPSVIIGTILVSYYFAKDKIKQINISSVYFKIIKKILSIAVICFFALELAIIGYPKHNEEKADYIIVLGAGLENGTKPSQMLKDRLDVAIRCLEESDSSTHIVVSGGQGSDEDLSEAEAMSEYLQEKGIDSSRIILENKSTDTNENLKYSMQKIKESSEKTMDEVKVKIVTTDFHAFRSSILAKKNGYVNFNNCSSPTVWYLIPSLYTREAVAIVKSTLFDK